MPPPCDRLTEEVRQEGAGGLTRGRLRLGVEERGHGVVAEDSRVLHLPFGDGVIRERVAGSVKEGGKILALRILPGVDVLETRWSGAKGIFDEAGLNVVGVEFTDGDPAKTKSIVSDYLQKEGSLDGVWMDAGATAVAMVEAFEDAGQEVPFVTGEDQNDFLTKWKEDGLKAVAPTYSNFQWRTAIIAATKILKGEEVPKEWILPQPKIDQSNLDQYVKPDMPPLYYALCGCEDLPGFPEKWGGK